MIKGQAHFFIFLKSDCLLVNAVLFLCVRVYDDILCLRLMFSTHFSPSDYRGSKAIMHLPSQQCLLPGLTCWEASSCTMMNSVQISCNYFAILWTHPVPHFGSNIYWWLCSYCQPDDALWEVFLPWIIEMHETCVLYCHFGSRIYRRENQRSIWAQHPSSSFCTKRLR